MKKKKQKFIFRGSNKYHHSKTQSGILYIFEKIIRSHPLLYFIFRSLIRFTNIIEQDFDGVKLITFKKKINIMDVGASDGIASKFFIKHLNVNKILCYEPNRHYVNTLRSLKIKKLIIKPYALGSKNMQKTIFYPSYRFFNRNLKLITYTHYDINFLKQQILLDFKYKKKISIVKKKILIKKIKNEKNKIDLIKIDTNGFELSVINGLKKIIRKDRPALILESNQDIKKIHKTLSKIKYESYYFSSNEKKLKIVKKKYPLNVYFLQKKHLI